MHNALELQNLGEANLVYSISKNYQDDSLNKLNARDQGGPDDYGYKWIDSNEENGPEYNWIEITDNAQTLTFNHNDEAQGPIDIGFDFNFYGDVYNELIINPNGWIGFGDDNTSWQNYPIPSTDSPYPAILAFNDDLNPLGENDGDVLYEAAPDKFIVWFDQVIHYPGQNNGTYTFQIILYPNGEFSIQYKEMEGDLNSATIGIQAPNASDGLQIAYNENYVEDNMAIEFKRVIDWLTIDTASGSIPANQIREISLEIDTQDLGLGQYECDLQLTTNDPENSLMEIPVYLEITNTLPNISVSSQNIDFDPTDLGSSSQQTITVTNTGEGTLQIYDIEASNNVFTAEPAAFELNNEEQQEVTLTFTPNEMQMFEESLTISSNADNNSNLAIQVSGLGQAAIIELAEMEMDFGSCTTEESAVDTLHISNIGNKSLEINNLSLQFPEIFIFEEETITLNPDEEYQLIIEFQPSEAVEYSDTLTVISNSYENDTHKIYLTGTGEEVSSGDVIKATKLYQNFPNPFTRFGSRGNGTTIRFALKERGNVNINVYNIRGELVKRLVNDELRADNHSVVWYGDNQYSNSVSSGVYLIRMKTQNYNSVKKVILLK